MNLKDCWGTFTVISSSEQTNLIRWCFMWLYVSIKVTLCDSVFPRLSFSFPIGTTRELPQGLLWRISDTTYVNLSLLEKITPNIPLCDRVHCFWAIKTIDMRSVSTHGKGSVNISIPPHSSSVSVPFLLACVQLSTVRACGSKLV